MKKRLTDRTIRALKPARDGERYIVKDDVVPGLGVRVTDKSAKSFVLHARYPGSPHATLSRFNRSLGQIASGQLNDASSALKAMGVSALDANGKLRDTPSILLDVAR